MHQASAPVFLQGLRALGAILEKATAHCQERKIGEAAFLTSRLYPDMLPLTRQVQLTADFAKNTMARLAAEEPVKIEDTEASFAELRARLERTAAMVEGYDPARIDGSEERDITIPAGGQPRTFKGRAFLLHFALPNFLFHQAMAYGLLRHGGVVIGKRDFLGPV